ncbi:hypothetical protein HQQ80_21780 [Microbacteriaceae bacterium VKM Ac-2855]|nr:hypothetical protein [Microbacteriaceae bacterium VKM Ac-2855]
MSDGQNIDLEPAREQLDTLGQKIGEAYRENPRAVIIAGLGALALLTVVIRLVSSKN